MFNTILIAQYFKILKKKFSSPICIAEDPWGKSKSSTPNNNDNNKPEKSAGPPDLDEFFSKLLKKKSGGGGGGTSHRSPIDFKFNGKILLGIIGVIVAFWLGSGFYTINARENGVVTFLGKYQSTTQSGLNWHWPYPIGGVEKVDVQSIDTMKVGEYTNQNSNISTAAQREGQMLTKDENIVEIGVAIQYRISDPKNYLYTASNPVAILNDVVTSAIREVVGANTVDDILKDRRTEWPQQVKKIIDDTIDKYQLGIEVVGFELQDARAPSEVQDAFQDAVRAREDEERYRLEAESYAKERLPISRGEAEQIMQEAKAYSVRVKEQAIGESSRFNALLDAYNLSPQIMKNRLYLDSMSKVLQNTQKIIITNDNIKPIINMGSFSNKQTPSTIPALTVEQDSHSSTMNTADATVTNNNQKSCGGSCNTSNDPSRNRSR